VPFFESPEGSQWPEDWSRDGRFILINDRNAGIVALPTKGDRKPIRVMLSDTGVIDYSQLSPDGHWMAYTSTESGQAEVRIASFPDFRNGKQVSASGGHALRWRQDGKELFYMTGDGQLMAVGFAASGSTFDTTAPEKLFATGTIVGTPGGEPYAVASDGRFLVLDSVEDGQPIVVRLNWTSMLK
jgi:hypothetical protein